MDILTLKLEEINNTTNELENSIFVIYDHVQSKFILKGKKKDMNNVLAYTYSFDCYSVSSLIEFILYVTSKSNVTTEILYNFNGISDDLNNTDYSSLYNLENIDYEISRHNNQVLSTKKLEKILGILQNVFNSQY